MSDAEAAREQAFAVRAAWTAALMLFGLRLFHLGGPLDDPHSWRQADTARYSLEFVRHGIDLLHPAVCWLGGHRVLIFEFPLPEAISAALQRAFGVGEHWDRIVALGFFAVATLYLHLFVRLAAGVRVAWVATLAWLAFPLGQFYSRAAHVDFAAIAGAHALLYHGARAVKGGGWGHGAAAAVGGSLAAMIKMPYLVPVMGPLAMVALSAASLAAVLPLAAALAVTAIAFKLWRGWVDATNAKAPDWSFLPGYYKEVNPLWWYFGEAKQRFEPGAWFKVGRRLFTEVATPPGVLLAFAAPLAAVRAQGLKFGARAIAVAWVASALAYLLVFFPLNVIHNYYQMPFLAPAALVIALGFEAMWTRVRIVAVLVFVGFLVMAAFVAPARLGYYRVDWLRVEAGRMIDARVPKGVLLIACDQASGYSDPRLLHRADRHGWSLAVADLTQGRVQRLAAEGAKAIAIVTSPDRPESAPPRWLAPWRSDSVAVTHAGRTLGTLTLYHVGEAR